MKIYCEHAALTREVKQLARCWKVDLLHFPYDPDSHTRKMGVATPSGAQLRDLNLPIRSLPGTIADYSSSDHSGEILSIIGSSNRRDALHVDSAFKSGCLALLTTDAHILKHKLRLERLLGMRFFHPGTDFSELEKFVRDNF